MYVCMRINSAKNDPPHSQPLKQTGGVEQGTTHPGDKYQTQKKKTTTMVTKKNGDYYLQDQSAGTMSTGWSRSVFLVEESRSARRKNTANLLGQTNRSDILTIN